MGTGRVGSANLGVIPDQERPWAKSQADHHHHQDHDCDDHHDHHDHPHNHHVYDSYDNDDHNHRHNLVNIDIYIFSNYCIYDELLEYFW